MDSFKILKWVGPETWLLTESGEIQVLPDDLILHEGNKITTGFMKEFLSNESVQVLTENTVLYKWVNSPGAYEDLYKSDLERRNPHAPVICTVDQSGPVLQSQKARDVMTNFGVKFGK